MKEIEGQLCIENIPVINLAREYGSPIFIYSADQIKNNFEKYQNEVGSHDLICYAVKANSNLPVSYTHLRAHET